MPIFDAKIRIIMGKYHWSKHNASYEFGELYYEIPNEMDEAMELI